MTQVWLFHFTWGKLRLYEFSGCLGPQSHSNFMGGGKCPQGDSTACSSAIPCYSCSKSLFLKGSNFSLAKMETAATCKFSMRREKIFWNLRSGKILSDLQRLWLSQYIVFSRLSLVGCSSPPIADKSRGHWKFFSMEKINCPLGRKTNRMKAQLWNEQINTQSKACVGKDAGKLRTLCTAGGR